MLEFGYIDVEETYLVYREARCGHSELGPTISRLFGEITAANSELECVGPPMVVYLEWSPEDCAIEAAFPVVPGSVPDPGSRVKTFPACTALFTTHRGAYSGLPDAWLELWKYVEANGVQVGMPCWDSYVVPPEPTEAFAVTELYVPLQ